MKSLFEQVNEIDLLIRQLQKIESKMRSGQWIDAWRECTRIMAYLEQVKKNVIEGEKNVK